MSIRNCGVRALCAAGVVAALAGAADASVIWSGSSGNLAAEAEFSLVGSDLVVRLANTSLFDVTVPADVLTAVFFDISGSAVTLTRNSAVIGPTSSVAFGGTDPGGVVGGEWAYKSGVSGVGGAAYVISSSGLNVVGPGDLFPGSDLQPPAGPDGLQYGITSAGDNLGTGNAAVTGGNALIKNEVIFTLGGIGAGFDLNRIGNVWFQYGTATDSEPNFPGTPTPGSLALLGLAALVGGRRRR